MEGFVFENARKVCFKQGCVVEHLPGPGYGKTVMLAYGGSVMDCYKAVSLAAAYDGDAWADFWAKPGVINFEPLPLGVVVTVAGTGSECNASAAITNEEVKVKTGRDYQTVFP